MTKALVGIFLCLFAAEVGAQQWPHPVPARVTDGSNRELFVMTLGDVQTPLADGVFDPNADEVRLMKGGIIKNYFRDSLGVRFYSPVDKTHFPLPPSGWCSWYFYYQQLDEREIMRNADWIAKNLKEYGAEYVQIDDGWQGIGHGLGENRDWTTIDKRFPGGMQKLAAHIQSLGLKAGLWLAPHGQSSEIVVRSQPNVFLLKPNDSTASNTWEGTFLVDPSTPQSLLYLKNLFTTLTKWSYDYFKIDGQPIVVNEYRRKRQFMKDTSLTSDEMYRKTLTSIREAIGSQRYLLGCWGIPLEGAGIMNGSRTGGDVVLGWSGFKVALSATMKYYFLHNIVWYCDPDVMLLRAPLTLDQARAWATLQGLTGQALMASDRMMDLSEERVNILRRVYPAVDIRPLDLFPSSRNKTIWDLKIHHLDRNYDVVALFNYDEEVAETRFVSWKDLAIPDTGSVHIFDYWNDEYLGAWEKGIALTLAPTSCRVLTLTPADDRIQLVSTNRHITQGWIDLVRATWNPKTKTYSGRSQVVKSDPYKLTFAFPRGSNFRISRANAGELPVRVTNHQGWATVEFTSPRMAEVNWNVTFEPTDLYHFSTFAPYGLATERVGLDGLNIQWSENYNLNAGYHVYLNGSLMGYTPGTMFSLRGLEIDSTYLVSVRTVWQDGTQSLEDASIKFNLSQMLLDQLWLDELEPEHATIGWGSIGLKKSVSGKTLSLGGKAHDRGIGTHARSEIEYNLRAMFHSFSATVGIDDGNGSDRGSVEFIVTGDGKELWRSGIMKKETPPKKLDVKIEGVRSLKLLVTDGGDDINYDHADWAEARISRAKASKQ